jgi:nucleotide-binding universal stress UspA family protein
MRVLLAVDSSSYSTVAARRVADRPWPALSVVRILSVAQLSDASDERSFWDSGAANEHLAHSILLQAEELVERVASDLRRSGLSVETAVRRGDPRSEIEDDAKTWNAELVVVGSHGRTGLSRWLLGSVAEHVVRHAHCSVEVCR